MNNSHCDLSIEFPEFKNRIAELKLGNNHFKKLYENYNSVSREIKKIEQRDELVSEESEIELRKSRLALKDELYSMLTSASVFTATTQKRAAGEN